MKPMIITDSEITIVFDDGPATVFASQPVFSQVLEAARSKDWDRAYELTRPAEAMKRKVTNDRVSIEDGVVIFDGNEMHGTLVDRMIQMADMGFDIEPLANFMVNLNNNPSMRAVNELYGFLEASNLPITNDGHFLAYKRVAGDFKDIYTGKIDNSIGQVVEMPRNKVDEEKSRTCSTGLHFCARSYLSNYGVRAGNATVVVKINPADVVAIPSDYNNAKGRTCRYEVVDQLVHSDEEELENNPVDNRDQSADDDTRSPDGISFSSRSKLRDFIRTNTGFKFQDRYPSSPRWIAVRV